MMNLPPDHQSHVTVVRWYGMIKTRHQRDPKSPPSITLTEGCWEEKEEEERGRKERLQRC